MGMTTVRSFPEPRPPHWGEFMWCKWCGDPIPKIIDGKSSTQRLWHPACKDQYFLHTRLEEQFKFLVGRDGERCAGCRAKEPQKWGHSPGIMGMTADVCRRGWRAGSKDMVELAATLWDASPKPWGARSPEERSIGWYQQIWLTSSLEVDHVIPLWSVAHLPDDERRWYFGPGNLWLLCAPCHKRKTRREAAERAAIRRFHLAQLTLGL